MILCKKLDQSLLDLAWSLWTELGVSGNKRNHQNCLIFLEELILLTVSLSEIDPRLRDESLDWCSKYHHLISVSRLKNLLKDFDDPFRELFSIYASTLNALSNVLWPCFKNVHSLNVVLSRKSCLRPLDSPALFNIRVRSIFGTGARADLITFLLIHENMNFAISDTVEIGYSKRNLAEILEELWQSGIVEKIHLRNQFQFRLAKREQLISFLNPLPKDRPSWRSILQLLLPIRDCLQRIEKYSESSQVIEIRNLLSTHQRKLQRLNLTPPPFESNMEKYLNSFEKWLINFVSEI